MNTQLVLFVKRERLHELCHKEGFYEEEIFRKAAIRVREEDLLEQPRFPSEMNTPADMALDLAKEILRIEYKQNANHWLSSYCPGWWERPTEKKRVEEARQAWKQRPGSDS